MKYHHLLIFSMALTLTLPLLAKKPFYPESINPITDLFRWKHIHELEGKGVRDFTETNDNILWFAANDGVFRYDGYNFELHDKTKGLFGFPVNKVFTAKNGDLYASTDHGIFMYKDSLWNNIFNDTTALFKIIRIREIPEIGVFFVSNFGWIQIGPLDNKAIYTGKIMDNAFFLVNNPQYKNFHLPLDIVTGFNIRITDILMDNEGYLWVSYDDQRKGSLIKFKPWQGDSNTKTPQFELTVSDDKIKLGITQTMIKASDGGIWVINNDYRKGINVFHKDQHRYIELSKLFGGDEFHFSIIENKPDEIMVGGQQKLFVYQHGKWSSYSRQDIPVPSSGRIITYQLKDKKILIGELQSKIFIYDGTTTQWKGINKLNFQFESIKNEKWFIDASGRIVTQNGMDWNSYGVEDGLMDSPVRVFETSKGQIWAIGSHKSTAATAEYKNQGWHLHTHPMLSWGIDYRALFEARDGSIWFGASVDFQREKGHLGGLLQLINPLDENKIWKHYHGEHGFDMWSIYGIGQSQDGKIWVGGNRTYVFENNKWLRFNTPPELTQMTNIVYSSSKSNKVYFGSRYYGLIFFDGVNWHSFNTGNGLISNNVINIYEVNDSSFWLATDNGISYFDGVSWSSNLFPAGLTPGLEGGTLCVDQEGYIWINKTLRDWRRRALPAAQLTQDIYDQYSTYSYVRDEKPPKTFFGEYINKIPSSGEITFSWIGKDFLKHTPDSELKYSYRLNEQEWSEFTSATYKTFYKLPPGKHVFEVRAKDLDLNTDTKPARAYFTVTPPIYKQAWFLAMIAAMAGLSFFFIFQIVKRDKKLLVINTELNETNKKLNQKKEFITKQNEQLNKLLEKNEKLSRSRLRFYTNISHEFRTPLTIILGNIDILISELSGKPKIQTLLNAVKRNARRLLLLTNQIIDLRRVEEGTLKLITRKGNLVKFIEELFLLFKPITEQKSITLTFNKNTSQNETFFDHDKIEKILFNLMSNAIKYTPRDGVITVSINRHHNTAENSINIMAEEYFKITVADTGIGIATQDLEPIFEPFFRVDSQENPLSDSESTGIGLSFTKQLIKAHKGIIKVESELGKGSAFYVYIPVLKEALNTQDEPADDYARSYFHIENNIDPSHEKEVESSKRKNEKEVNAISQLKDVIPNLLIVEDNNEMRDFIRTSLKGNYMLTEAVNGEQALELIKETEFDLILCDIAMPVMDGISFCKIMKGDLMTSHIPVVFLTARSLEDQVVEGLKVGAEDYIIKPFNARILNAKIETIIQNRRKLQKKYKRSIDLEPSSIAVNQLDEEFMRKIIDIIEKNIDNSEFAVKEICDEVHMSHASLYRKIKSLTDQTIIEFIRTIRLKRAAQLLMTKGISISEVVYTTGFSSRSYFSQIFNEMFGVTPKQYYQNIHSADVRDDIEGDEEKI